jgi:flagellar motor switch protein FliN/FliY
MAEPEPQSNVDNLAAQVQANNALAAQATEAIDAAAQQAADIAGEIASAPAGAAPAAPVQDAAAAPAAPAQEPAQPLSPELRRLLAIEVPIIVQLGARRLTVGEVMRFAVGAIIEFNKAADEELDLLASNKPIGKGQAVKVGENFGIRIAAMSPVKETIRKLGGF